MISLFRFPLISFCVHSVSSAAAFRSILGFLPLPSAAADFFPRSGGTLAEQRGHRGSASEMSTYVRQDGHAAARIAGCGDRLRFPAEDEEEEVDADDVDDVAGDAVVLPAAARSRAERTMSRVQTAAELVVGAAGGGRLRSWCPPCTLGWRGVRNVLPDCEKNQQRLG